jgi:hypothetical protein
LTSKGDVMMRNGGLRLFALCLTAALGACAGANPATPGVAPPASVNAERPSWWREAPDSARAGVYVAQANGAGDGLVFGYGPHNRGDNPPQCSLSGLKLEETQIATDAKGNLYLPNVALSALQVYAPHCGRLLKTLDDSEGGGDLAVAVDGTRSYVGGGTHVSACGGSGCTVKLTDDSILQLESIAVDHSGNVWASYYSQSLVPSLIVWPGGQMPGRVVTGYVNQNTPGGLSFDKDNTLVSIQSRFLNVYVYRCQAATASCTNTQTFTLKAASVFGALNAKNTNYQATDYANDSVDVYAYPSFKYLYSYSNGLMSTYSLEGIAQSK